MMVDIPSHYPNPEMSPHSMEINTGTTRMEMQAGNSKQRRYWFFLPVKWALTWKANTVYAQDIVRWLNRYGYDWFGVKVVGPLNTTINMQPLKLMSLRLISDLQISRVGHDLWSISGSAEGEPSQTITKGESDD